MTVWLLGIKPSKPGARALTPTGAKANSADRLRIMLGLSVEEFLRTFPLRENVLNSVRGRRMAKQVSGTVYVFGHHAWWCMGLPRKNLWESHGRGDTVFILVPHPSGRSITYNDHHNVERLRRLMCRHLSRSTSSITASL
jgi:hypothetical protein